MSLPGSKSISNRVLLLAALAEGRTEITGLLDSDDTRVMLTALRQLGVNVSELDAGRVTVEGVRRFPVESAELFMGNAGTAIRPLTAALALMGGDYKLSGVPRMHERPIGDLGDALNALGARVGYLGQPGYPPLHIGLGEIIAGAVTRVQGSVSSQFLTALLLAAPIEAGRSGKPMTIEVVGELISKPYIEITLNLMARFGVTVRRDGWSRFVIEGGAAYRSPGRIAVEGDASTASYFLALGAIGGGPLRVSGVGADSIQGDVGFAQTLADMGASVSYGPDWIEVSGVNVADGERLKAFDTDFNLIPDAAMTAAALAPVCRRPVPAAQHRQLAREGNGPYPRHADRAGEAGRDRGIGAGLAARDAARPGRLARCAHRHLGRPSHGHVLLPGRVRPAVRILDPGCVSKTFPGYFDVYAGLVSA